MIIGRDLMQFLGIDVLFSTLTVEWDGADMPFKDVNAPIYESYHVAEPAAMEEKTNRVKKILDAKYEAADLEQICSKQDQLGTTEQHSLRSLLDNCDDLFDGTLGSWKGSEVNLELKDGATPYHARAYPVPKIH